MKYDAARNEREIREVADLVVAAAVGWLAAMALKVWPLVAIAVAVVVFRRAKGDRGGLWKKPTTILAVLALALVWLWSDWSSYQRGVFAGFDAAAHMTQR